MISVVQSSVENQDPVEEDLIEKSTAESESFLRSFVRRLPSERQPSEIFEEEAVIEEILPAISTSQVESLFRLRKQQSRRNRHLKLNSSRKNKKMKQLKKLPNPKSNRNRHPKLNVYKNNLPLKKKK